MIGRKIPHLALPLAMLALVAVAAGAVKADAGDDAAPAAIPPAAKPAALDPAEAEGIIFERQQAMKQLEQDADKLGDVIAGLAPRDQLGATARAIAKGAKDAQETFAQQVPGGRAKPEVWSNREDYDRRMEEFVRKSDAMAVLAEAGNLNAVVENLNDAMPCKGCHDIYRTPKKPS